MIAVVHDRIHEMGHRVSGAVATVAAITVTSARSAGYLMDTSLGIVDRPAVWTALADGTIDHTRAQVIVDGLIQLDDPDRGLLEAKALTYAASPPPTRPAATSRGCWSTTAPTWPTRTTTRNGPKPGTAATSRCSPAPTAWST